jgi:hypothetical protein
MSPEQDALYNTLKANEANFPLPKPSTTIDVGTFDAQTGEFKYSIQTYSHQQPQIVPPDPTGHGPEKPVIVPRSPMTGGTISINTYTLILRFNVSGRQGDLMLDIGGYTIHAPQGQDYVEWDPGTASSVTFLLSCSGHNFNYELPLRIDRGVVLGVGALTVPALPITIVYAPPVDQQKKNTSKWTVSETTGNTITVSFSQENSTTKPAVSQFQDLADLTSDMKGLSTALSLVPQATVKAIGQILGALSALLGSTSATETKGTAFTDQQGLTVTASKQSTFTTDPKVGGPGSGDIIAFLENAKLCWFSSGGSPLKLTLIGWDDESTCHVSDLLTRQGGHTTLDQNTIQALLKLDPFVTGGPEVDLSVNPRFAYIDTYKVETNITVGASHTLTTSDVKQYVSTTIDTETDTAGLFAFLDLGIGVPQTQTIKTTLTQGSAAQTTTTQTITNEIDFYSAPGEPPYTVDLYCDVVFGTFAYRVVPEAEPRDESGRPIRILRPDIFINEGPARYVQPILPKLPQL